MKKNNKNNIRRFVKLMAIFWVSFLMLFFLIVLVKPEKDFSDVENRVLQERPELTMDAVLSGDYENQFEDYLGDQFPFRNTFVGIKTFVDSLLGKKESHQVVKCKKGYLMEEFLPEEQSKQDERLAAIKKFASQYPKIKQYFLLAPTAINVMREQVPTGMVLEDQNQWMNSFFQEMKDIGIQVIDVRERFQKETERPLYYQTDHHWTTFGAYLAFQQAAGVLGLDADAVQYKDYTVTDSFRGSLTYKSGFEMGKKEELHVFLPQKGGVASVVNYVEEQKKASTIYDHTKLQNRDAYEVFFGGNHSLVKIQSVLPGNQKVLLVLKDSYANCLIPFLQPYFSEILVVDPRYYYDNLGELMKAESVTDILYCYNANTFFQDNTLASVLRES